MLFLLILFFINISSINITPMEKVFFKLACKSKKTEEMNGIEGVPFRI